MGLSTLKLVTPKETWINTTKCCGRWSTFGFGISYLYNSRLLFASLYFWAVPMILKEILGLLSIIYDTGRRIENESQVLI